MSSENVSVTFQVPKTLKHKMEADQRDWSVVVRQAIEAQLALSSTSLPLPAEDEVLQRLRQSRDEYEKNVFDAGQKAGIEWVSMGNFSQLRRFERLWNETQDQWSLWCTTDGSNYSASQYFFFAIEPTLNGEWREAQEFWERLLGESNCEQSLEDEFLRGFMTAAMERWEALQSKL